MTGDAMNVSGSQQYNNIKLKYFGSLIHHHHILEALQDQAVIMIVDFLHCQIKPY